MRVEDFSMLMRMVDSVNNDLAEAEGRIVERVKGKLEIILNEMYVLRSQFEEVEQPIMLEEEEEEENVSKTLKDYDCRDTYATATTEEEFDDDDYGADEDEECTTEQPRAYKEYCRPKTKKELDRDSCCED